MTIIDKYQQKQVFSFEMFPPKGKHNMEKLHETIDLFSTLKPDFISVTMGAGGVGNSKGTVDITDDIQQRYQIDSVVHLPSIHLSKPEVSDILADLKRRNISNILALRGDERPGTSRSQDFNYASDLIEFIKESGDFNILAACYPEGHTQSASIVEDVKHLKRKADAGVDAFVTQLFLDNEYFYRFRERADIVGIDQPISAGIMPVTSKKQIERMIQLTGANLPKKFVSIIDRFGDNPKALLDAGIAYAVDQIIDLLAQDVNGIHLYTMNNSYIAKNIYRAIKNIV